MADSEPDEGETAYTVERIPSAMWNDWKDIVPRSIRLADRIIRLVAADLAADRKHRMGLIELAIEEDLLDESDVEAALESSDE